MVDWVVGFVCAWDCVLAWDADVELVWVCLSVSVSVMVVSLVVLDGGCVSVSPFVVIDGWVVVSVVDPLVFSGVSSVVSFDVFCEVAAAPSSVTPFEVPSAVFSSLMWVEALLVDAADEGSRLAAKAKLGVRAITLNNMAHATASAKDMKREGIFFCFMINLIY